MKTISLILLLMVCNTTIKAQENILKKANTIIIYDSLDQGSFYNKIIDILYESGYGILNTDKSLGVITTTEKSFKNGVIKLNFLIKDRQVTLRGDYKDNIEIAIGGVSSLPSWSTIIFAGQKNSITRNAWDELTKLSDQIPGSKEYLIK